MDKKEISDKIEDAKTIMFPRSIHGNEVKNLMKYLTEKIHAEVSYEVYEFINLKFWDGNVEERPKVLKKTLWGDLC